MNKLRVYYSLSIIMTIIIGISSRVFETGNPVFDKYLGDALYAILIYLLLGFLWDEIRPIIKLIISTIVVLMIEIFQISGIPLQLSQSDNILLRIISILIGTEFSFYDIYAYIIGLVIMYLLDVWFRARSETILSDIA